MQLEDVMDYHLSDDDEEIGGGNETLVNPFPDLQEEVLRQLPLDDVDEK